MAQPNAQMKSVLDSYAQLGPLPVESLSPFNARQLPTLDRAVIKLVSQSALERLTTPAIQTVAKVEHILIPGPDGDLLARVYTPQGQGPFPVLIYFHGGGWVIANLDVYDSSCRALTQQSESIVVSVAYRQAPENTFPAAAEDAYAATQWIMTHANEIGGDPARVAITGESAGGNLATVACLMTRDRGGVMPAHQLLVYPITNMEEESSTYAEFADAKPLNSAMMRWFKKYYLGDTGDAGNPYVSPLKADVSGLPSATVITAEIDPLRAEGEAYGEKLKAAGIPTTVTRYNGVTHEFFSLPVVVDEAKNAVRQASAELKDAFQKRRLAA